MFELYKFLFETEERRKLARVISPEGININSPVQLVPQLRESAGLVGITNYAAHEDSLLKPLSFHAPQNPNILKWKTKNRTMTRYLLSPFQGFVSFAICQHRALPYAIAVTLAGAACPIEPSSRCKYSQPLSPEGININSPQPAPTSRGIYPGVYVRTARAAHESSFLKLLHRHAPQLTGFSIKSFNYE
jgi:hypothetical protein